MPRPMNDTLHDDKNRRHRIHLTVAALVALVLLILLSIAWVRFA